MSTSTSRPAAVPAPAGTLDDGANARARRAKARRERRGTLAATVVVAVVVVGMLSPFAWAGLTAVKPFYAAFTNPPTWSFTPQFDAFTDLWRGTYFAAIAANTLAVAVAAVLVMLVVGAPAAYAFARYAGVIGPVLLVIAVVLRTVPRFAVVLPLYEASRAVGLYDTNIALVAAFVAVNMPFTLLLLVGFFRDIPVELDEAAMVDGCSRFGAFRRVIVPVMGPGLVTAGVFTFLVAFQEYLIALTLTQNDAVTIPVFIAAQRGADEISTYQLLAAASIALVLPIALIAVGARRYLVAGLGGGAVKG